VNRAIIELQRDLLLEQLMEVEEQLNNEGIKKYKQGFTLFMRNGVFYVRYTDSNGKQLYTNRSLHTADKEEAKILAKKYRESILKSYYDKKNKVKDIYTFFSNYYKVEKSPYLQELLKKGKRSISKPIIKHSEGFIKNYFIPFLKENKIKKITEINLKTLESFQTYLVEKELKPKTINNNINGAIKPIFTNLLLKGVIKDTPFISDSKNYRFNLPEKETYRRRHIIQNENYNTLAVLMNSNMWKLYKTKGDMVTNKIANPKHYKKYRLICLLAATCGLRNAEIFMLRKENIIKIRRTYFIDVVNSHIENIGLKTENAERKVPIPAITLEALNDYIAENKITDYLFYSGSKTIHYNMFGFARNQLGTHLGYTEKELKELDFDFYSLRGFYETMLQTSNIRQSIINYFIGHSVNVRDMPENYFKREDLDDIFFEENGLKVIEYIDTLCQKVIEHFDLHPADYTRIEQIALTDNKGNTKIYYAEILNKLDFETETYYYLGDLIDMNLLPGMNDKDGLIKGLKELLENETIDKRRYDDCIDCVKNME
jgi:integrase